MEKCHPVTMLADRAANILNDKAMLHFRAHWIRSNLVMCLECRFLDTEVDGSNPGNSM